MVTGASRGIGRAITIELAQAGASVAINYAGNEVAAQQTAQLIIDSGGQARIYKADVADYAQVNAMMKRAVADFGHIDILVNNAGVLARSFLMMMSSEDFRRVIDVNLVGTFHCTKAVALHMMKRKAGVIVNVSSLAGNRGLIGQGAYAASKAAINNFTQVSAKEFAAYGIRVNAVAPGCIDAGMMKNFNKEVEKSYIQQISQKRYGEAGEVAKAVLFLVSDMSSYVTGHVLNVDGGLLG
jgi:3-oxoacyl-[acyl-carrier protein] reductase